MMCVLHKTIFSNKQNIFHFTQLTFITTTDVSVVVMKVSHSRYSKLLSFILHNSITVVYYICYVCFIKQIITFQNIFHSLQFAYMSFSNRLNLITDRNTYD